MVKTVFIHPQCYTENMRTHVYILNVVSLVCQEERCFNNKLNYCFLDDLKENIKEKMSSIFDRMLVTLKVMQTNLILLVSFILFR